MKKIIIALAVIFAAATSVSAQERAAGIRVGGNGFDLVYQHSLSKNTFIEGNMGFDFGVKMYSGIKFTGLYNMILARPAWTQTGSWAIYAGAGLSLGNVYDMVRYDIAGTKVSYPDNGFMLAAAFQAGLEYNFDDIPLQLAIDLRPMLGLHVNDGTIRIPGTSESVEFESKTGFYAHGLAGFIPSLSVRYRF